ncbi:MAG: hypothetical protein J6S09_05425 [Paludibacteraceae bacterium]|nr:hypothetical protein [Paludibacteraceae bacterium]
MKNLEQLRESIRILEEMKSISLTPETLKAVDELKERIIRDGILPALSEQVAPLLKPIQPESVLVSEPNTNEEISADDTPSDSDEQTSKKHGRSTKTQLRVTLNDGTIIQQRKACDTVVKAIQKAVAAVGIDEIRKLGLVQNSVSYISDMLDDFYSTSQKPIGNGWYVMTHGSNDQKKEKLDIISRELKLGWKVEVLR